MLSTTKDMYIMNPYTHRMIVKGGRVYKNLVKKGLLDINNSEIVDKTTEPLVSTEMTETTEQQKEPEEPKKLVGIEIPQSGDDVKSSKFEEIINNLKEKNKDYVSELIAKASENVFKKYQNKLCDFEDDKKLYDEINSLIELEIEELLEY